jgi:hypothetical protein
MTMVNDNGYENVWWKSSWFAEKPYDSNLHIVVLETDILDDAELFIKSKIKPWLIENTQGRVQIRTTWKYDHKNRYIIGTKITFYFDDLAEATLFRLKF